MEMRECSSCGKKQMWDELHGYANQMCPEFCTMKFTEILPMSVDDCWIDINEAWPEVSKHVLTFEIGSIAMPIKVNYIANQFTQKFAYGDTVNITHWMPLPDHPR